MEPPKYTRSGGGVRDFRESNSKFPILFFNLRLGPSVDLVDQGVLISLICFQGWGLGALAVDSRLWLLLLLL